ncbi:hypothetical protein ILUMI_24747 [Ignelater luminosus]|uniref:Integrase zinc-binding domain-containing protein n=1 Tax=Ignelater luminosus TaxID=2038154 RepID=A0A8K0CCX2_IGNLU|nr:hypothetical protein ILUMI_24747 [Ignelater luminosus]
MDSYIDILKTLTQKELPLSFLAADYGVDRTYRRIAQRYFWIGMKKYIAEYLKNCGDCQRYKASNQKPAGLSARGTHEVYCDRHKVYADSNHMSALIPYAGEETESPVAALKKRRRLKNSSSCPGFLVGSSSEPEGETVMHHHGPDVPPLNGQHPPA